MHLDNHEEPERGFGAMFKIPGRHDFKLRCIQFLGCHGTSNIFANGEIERRTNKNVTFSLRMVIGGDLVLRIFSIKSATTLFIRTRS
jgi:hypothetical protein